MAPHTPQRSERPGKPVALLGGGNTHRLTWGAPTWPPTPPSARSAPGNPWRSSVTRVLIGSRGGPRHGPPHPPTLGRAPAEPWRASGLTQDVSSAFRVDLEGRPEQPAAARGRGGERGQRAHRRPERAPRAATRRA